MKLRFLSHEMTLARPRVMGVLNVTPDSFFDGGRYIEPASAIAHGVYMAKQGADILDIGGESSRPGALPAVSYTHLTLPTILHV